MKKAYHVLGSATQRLGHYPTLPWPHNIAIIAILGGHMRSVNIADLKNNLSRYLNQVRQGEEVLIRDRNLPIAKIVPLSSNDEEEELLRLVAEGLIRLPEKYKGFPRGYFTAALPKVKVDVLKMLREERDER
jgi:prevent-host-death family protein